jgi:predicted chitinase
MATMLQLASVCTRAPLARLTRVFESYNAALVPAGATTPLREAMFLAQIAHETDQFHYSHEVWGPTPQQLRYEPPSPLAAKLGNTQPGDGARYRGRGWFQLTGRRNYTLAEAATGIPLVAHPELAEDPRYLGLVAAWYWRNAEDRKGVVHDLNVFGDAGDLHGCTLVLNGGLTGFDSRQSYFGLCCAALGAQLPVVA